MALTKVSIGPQSILSIPGELYTSLGLRIKEGFEPRPVIAGYANGNVGYIPDANSFAANHPADVALNTWRKGIGYGTFPLMPAHDIGDRIVASARALLLNFH